jgi:SAM-dependent methyltransferase
MAPQPFVGLPLLDASADVICAFSVFTHMEHEDSWRFLADALRVIRLGGHFVFSMSPARAQGGAADLPRHARVVTLRTLEPRSQRHHIARFHGRDRNASPMERRGVVLRRRLDVCRTRFGERAALGQSVCVLERPRTI